MLFSQSCLTLSFRSSYTYRILDSLDLEGCWDPPSNFLILSGRPLAMPPENVYPAPDCRTSVTGSHHLCRQPPTEVQVSLWGCSPLSWAVLPVYAPQMPLTGLPLHGWMGDVESFKVCPKPSLPNSLSWLLRLCGSSFSSSANILCILHPCVLSPGSHGAIPLTLPQTFSPCPEITPACWMASPQGYPLLEYNHVGRTHIGFVHFQSPRALCSLWDRQALSKHLMNYCSNKRTTNPSSFISSTTSQAFSDCLHVRCLTSVLYSSYMPACSHHPSLY